MSPDGWWIQTVVLGAVSWLFHPAKKALYAGGTVPPTRPPVISTKQKSEGVLFALNVAPDNDSKEGELLGFVHPFDSQLNLKIHEVGLL